MEEECESFMSTWNVIVYSINETIFLEAWKLFEIVYKEKAEVQSYIKLVVIVVNVHPRN